MDGETNDRQTDGRIGGRKNDGQKDGRMTDKRTDGTDGWTDRPDGQATEGTQNVRP